MSLIETCSGSERPRGSGPESLPAAQDSQYN